MNPAVPAAITTAFGVQYIQVETIILFLFLCMMMWMQWTRPSHSIVGLRNNRKQMMWLLLLFPILAGAFGILLSSISPVFGIELALGVSLSLLHPVNALAFMVHMLFLRPWDIVPNNTLLLALPRSMAVLCLISWFIHPSYRSKPTLQASHALLLLLGFSVWLFLSTFVTPDVAAAQSAWFDNYFRSLIVFVMCSYFIENEHSVSEFKYTILWSIMALAILGFYQYLFLPSDDQYAGRLGSIASLANPNDLAAICIIAFPLALTPLFRKRSGLGRQTAGLLLAIIAALAIWYTRSRGALMALMAQIFALPFITNFKKRGLSGFLILGIMVVGYIGLMKAMPRNSQEMEESSESRLSFWEAAVNMTIHHPLLGVGYDQFPRNYDSYNTAVTYEWGEHTAHSTWLLAFAESGLFGGCLFIAFFLAIWRAAWRNRQERPDQFYALGGYAVAMSFLSHTYILFPYLLYGLILASDSIKQRALDHE